MKKYIFGVLLALGLFACNTSVYGMLSIFKSKNRVHPLDFANADCHLLSIPNDVFVTHIFSFLPLLDAKKVSLACEKLRELFLTWFGLQPGKCCVLNHGISLMLPGKNFSKKMKQIRKDAFILVGFLKKLDYLLPENPPSHNISFFMTSNSDEKRVRLFDRTQSRSDVDTYIKDVIAATEKKIKAGRTKIIFLRLIQDYLLCCF